MLNFERGRDIFNSIRNRISSTSQDNVNKLIKQLKSRDSALTQIEVVGAAADSHEIQQLIQLSAIRTEVALSPSDDEAAWGEADRLIPGNTCATGANGSGMPSRNQYVPAALLSEMLRLVPDHHGITQLVLRTRPDGPELVEALAHCLSRSPSLRTVRFAHIVMGPPDEAMSLPLLGGLAKASSALTSAVLTDIGLADAQGLVLCLAKNKWLRTLDISHNPLGGGALCQLAKPGEGQTPGYRRRRSALVAFAEGLSRAVKEGSSLQSLRLIDTRMNNYDLEALCAALDGCLATVVDQRDVEADTYVNNQDDSAGRNPGERSFTRSQCDSFSESIICCPALRLIEIGDDSTNGTGGPSTTSTDALCAVAKPRSTLDDTNAPCDGCGVCIGCRCAANLNDFTNYISTEYRARLERTLAMRNRNAGQAGPDGAAQAGADGGPALSTEAQDDHAEESTYIASDHAITSAADEANSNVSHAALQSQVAQQQQTMQQLRHSLDETNKAHSALQERYNQLLAAHTRTNNALAELKKKEATLESQVTDLSQRNEGHESLLRDLSSTIANLRAEVDSSGGLDTHPDADAAEDGERRPGLKQELARLQEELTKAKADAAAAQAENAVLRNQYMAELRGAIEALAKDAVTCPTRLLYEGPLLADAASQTEPALRRLGYGPPTGASTEAPIGQPATYEDVPCKSHGKNGSNASDNSFSMIDYEDVMEAQLEAKLGNDHTE